MKLTRITWLIYACLSLVWMPVRAGADNLVDRLTSPDDGVQGIAQSEIARLDHSSKQLLAQSLLRVIEDAVSDTSLPTANRARRTTSAFRQLGPDAQATIPTLIELLASPKGKVDVAAIASAALSSIGSASIAALRQALRNPNDNVRFYAANALGNIKPPAIESIPSLVELLKDPNPEVKNQAKYALGCLGREGDKALRVATNRDAWPDSGVEPSAVSIKEWSKRLKSRNPSDRVLACDLLLKAHLPTSQTVPLLGRLLTSDPDFSVRSAAIRDIGAISDVKYPATPYLIQVLQYSDDSVRTQAIAVLRSKPPLPQKAISAFIALIDNYATTISTPPLTLAYKFSFQEARNALKGVDTPGAKAAVKKATDLILAREAGERAALANYGAASRDYDPHLEQESDNLRKQLLYHILEAIGAILGFSIFIRLLIPNFKKVKLKPEINNSNSRTQLPSIPIPTYAKRWLKRFIYSILGLWLLLPYLHLPAIVPPISGRVVDAMTGQSIRGIDVALLAYYSSNMNSHQIRKEKRTTGWQGRFYFLPSLESSFNYSDNVGPVLTINQRFEYLYDKKSGSMRWDVGTDSTNQISLTEAANKSYFPMVVRLGAPCMQAQNVMYNINCISAYSTRNIRVPLIPVLDKAEDCKRIGDSSLREPCRQLNTFMSAFRHIGTIAEVRKAKELCRAVDQGIDSKTCMDSLGRYIAERERLLPNEYYSPALESEFDPLEKALILSPIAGLQIQDKNMSNLNLFWESARYSARYGTIDKPFPMTSVLVEVNQFETEEKAKKELSHPHYDNYKAGNERAGTFEGKSIITLELPLIRTVFWVSRNKVVSITFNKAAQYTSGVIQGSVRWKLAQKNEAPLSVRKEFIRRYLSKYPSSLSEKNLMKGKTKI